MVTWTCLFFAALIAGSALALPTARQFGASCNLTNARLRVPANQTQLIAPTYAPHFLALGVGTQNYTCDATSTYTLVGAYAELFDSSCLYDTPTFKTALKLAFTLWNATGGLLTPQDVITTLSLLPNPLVLGQHMFIPNPSGEGLSPMWDFTSSGGTAGNTNAYVVGDKVGDLPSRNSANVDSLMLKGIEGDLASLIFRVHNNGGQPPAQCDVQGSNITVKYTAMYWFFGGNVTSNNLFTV